MFDPSPVAERERESPPQKKKKKKRGGGLDILIPEPKVSIGDVRNGEGRDIQFQFRDRLKEEEGGRRESEILLLEIRSGEYF